MFIGTGRRAALAAAGTVALTAASLVGVAGAQASSPARVPVVIAHVSGKSISLSTGRNVHAGRIIFRVVSRKGYHSLQVLRLHRGYTLAQAGADFAKAFQGNVAAVRRIDNNITFRGGAQAHPGHPGRFGINLNAGRFVLVDQNSNAYTFIHVYGKTPQRATIPNRSAITLFTYGFGNTPTVLPARGWTFVSDHSDQPHFLVMQHVKRNTTAALVRRAFRPGARQPSFALRANTSTGVLSPNKGQAFYYHMPRGKYVLACFWPDDDTGMPHAFMGMWKLVILK
jgi:hypothetical protein